MSESTQLDRERLWKVQDVAEFLGVSSSWVYLHVGMSDLPYRRVGALLRFFPEDVRAYARGEWKGSRTVLPLETPHH